MDILQAARQYLGYGFSTIPINMIRSGQKVKKIAIVKWEEYQQRHPTEEELERFFNNESAHIAIITGKISNLVVVDIDHKESYNEIKNLLPKTVTVKTPGGGYHFYFKYTDKFYTIARIDKKGLDIRAEGGYVVAPPSTYPEGNPYFFVEGRGPGDVPVVEMPQNLVDYLLSFGKTSDKKKEEKKKEGPPNAEQNWFDESIKGVGEGNRNDTAIRLLGYFWHYRLPKKTIRKLMEEWNSKCNPPMSDSELDTLVTSFFKRNLDQDMRDVIDELNDKHAIVRIGNSVGIMEKFMNEMSEQDFRVLKQTDFNLLYKNRTLTVNRRPVPISNIWIESDRRKDYDGIIFDPDNTDPRYYNLWTGFSRKPKPGGWDLFRKHIEDIIAPEYSDWLLTWMARIVQDPGGPRPGTVPVLRGEQGTGKSIFVNIFGELFGKHYTMISSVKGITRQFTHYLKDNVLLFLDEGIWGGDKQSMGALKSIITEPWRVTEPKGFEAFRIKNHINLIIASNEEWIVPGGIGERRFLVMDVKKDRQKDYEYFQRMANQMYQENGIEAMMYDLMTMDTKEVNLREIPGTEGTRDQIVHSMSLVASFWLERLEKCTLVDSHDYWKNLVVTEKLYEQYKEYVKERHAHRAIVHVSHFIKELKHYCPGMEHTRKRHGDIRFYALSIPDLTQCRNDFDTVLGIKHHWQEICESDPPENNEDRLKDVPGSHRKYDPF